MASSRKRDEKVNRREMNRDEMMGRWGRDSSPGHSLEVFICWGFFFLFVSFNVN